MNDFQLTNKELRVNAKSQIQTAYSEWEQQTIRLLNEYLGYLHHFKITYAPKTAHEPVIPLFAESLHAIPLIEYYLDILTFEPLAVRQQFLQEFVKQLDEIEKAAIYRDIGRNTLRSLNKNNKLPALMVGRKNVIRTDVLEQFLTLNQGVNLLDFENVKSI